MRRNQSLASGLIDYRYCVCTCVLLVNFQRQTGTVRCVQRPHARRAGNYPASCDTRVTLVAGTYLTWPVVLLLVRVILANKGRIGFVFCFCGLLAGGFAFLHCCNRALCLCLLVRKRGRALAHCIFRVSHSAWRPPGEVKLHPMILPVCLLQGMEAMHKHTREFSLYHLSLYIHCAA